MADLDRQATELETLMHSLAFADEGAGVVQTANSTMRQKDIDFLVAILQELQGYREIGTVEECRAYKEKALG